MPKVPERKLSYGEAQERERRLYKSRNIKGTRTYPTVHFVEPRKGSKHGATKVTLPAAEYGYGKVTQHLRDIMHED